MVKWEYKRVKGMNFRTAEREIMDWFNELGNDGWEFMMKNDDYWYFKRPKQ